MLESQFDAKIYLQPTLEARKQNFKCPNKTQASLLCINPLCQVPGLMCTSATCNCLNKHQNCHHIQLKKVLKIIDKHQQQQISQGIRKSYKATDQIINLMIQQLSSIRARLEQEQRYFGLTKNEISFMMLVNEEKYDKICGKFVSELEKSFEAGVQFVMQTQEDIVRDFKRKKIEFYSFCQYIEENYMKHYQKEVNLNIFGNSKIVKLNSQKKKIHKWLCEALGNANFQQKLLFRASEHSFSASKFHKYCDGFENTLVIIKTELDKIIGGFTPSKWQSSFNQKFVSDETGMSFIFSLNLNEKYNCTDSAKSILCHSNFGPCFGGDDIYLSDDANMNQFSYAEFPTSYNLLLKGTNKYEKYEKYDKNRQNCIYLAANQGFNFKVKQYEVYQIKRG